MVTSKKSAWLVAAVSATVAMATATTAHAAGTDPGVGAKGDSPFASSARHTDRKGFYDAREGATRSAMAGQALRTAGRSDSAGPRGLRRLAGDDASIAVDPNTGTPANLMPLDGYLTSKSSRPAKDIVLSYARDHAAALGLTSNDVSTFDLRSSDVDPDGTTHLSFTQSTGGVPVFGNGLRAHVTRDGQIIALQGSPVSGLATKAQGTSTTPDVTASTARSRSASDVGGSAAAASTRTGGAHETTWTNGDTAELVWFADGDALRLGWSTYTQAGGDRIYTHVIDADSGAVLYRRDLVDSDSVTAATGGAATGTGVTTEPQPAPKGAKGDALVYPYYPGAAKGGTPQTVNLYDQGWLTKNADWLQGKYSRTWADVNDDNAVQKREKSDIPGSRSTGAQFKLNPFNDANKLCSNKFICTWDPEKPYSWQVNENADAVNGFYLVSTYHDYLAKKPFGFDAGAGNFELGGGDPVLQQVLDGADTADGLPDANHIDNANFATPPDGTAPTMQMYLWHQPGTTNKEDPFLPVSGAFDASIVLHEYTHGLSNRLVVDPSGNSTLNGLQAGAMGEAWSDYYAMDYLVDKGLQKDTNADGEVLEGKYVIGGKLFRTQAIDCSVGSVDDKCVGIDGDHGGYTYGDVPTIGGTPEVHSSGEVWAQTLWDIRKEYGHDKADRLITRAMSLSPADPSMLDMRNAILAADKVSFGGDDERGLWRLFANRGMGWYAGSIDSGDTQPAEDFHVRPAPEKGVGTLAGRVRDANTGDPLPGALVKITGHDSGFIGSFTARTDADGRYAINNVPPGTYQKVVVIAKGYELQVKKVKVTTGNGNPTTFRIRRDWAASSGGGSITDFNGPDYSDFGCGPTGAIDLSQGTGWGSTTGDKDGTPTGEAVPKYITIKLPQAIDISKSGDTTAFAVDPTATCGDPGSSSTGEYTIEVSPTGETGSWTTAVNGTGDRAFTAANRFRYTDVASDVNAADVRYVRFTMVSPQVPDFATNCPDGPYGGCQYMDLTEVEVFGTPSSN